MQHLIKKDGKNFHWKISGCRNTSNYFVHISRVSLQTISTIIFQRETVNRLLNTSFLHHYEHTLALESSV